MRASIQPFYSITLADGDILPIAAYGRYLTVLKVTGSDAVSVKFPGQPFVRLREGLGVELPQGPGFDAIVLKNEEGASITFDIIISESRVFDNGGADIGAALSNILDELTGKNNTVAEFGPITVGTSFVEVVAAASTQRRVNIGYTYNASGFRMYLGLTNSVLTTADYFSDMLAGGFTTLQNHAGAVYAISNGASQSVYGWTE